MRASLALIALVATATGLSAQANPQNHTQIWDQTTEFTSRGSNGGNPGNVGQAFQYGFIANLRTLTRTQYAMQDQDLSTREPWDVGTNGLDANALADFKNLNAYSTNLLLPGGTGIGAFLVTHTGLRGTPHKVKANECAEWFHQWHFQQKANWTTDGISVHMSQAAPWRSTRLCNSSSHREIPRVDGSPLAQIIEELSFTGVANNPDPTFNNRSWRHVLSFQEPVLKGFSDNTTYNSGCPNPNPGYASIDPNFADHGGQQPGRFDNPVWEVRSAAHASGIAVLFWSTTVIPGGGVSTPFGKLHLNLADPLFALGPQAMPPLSGTGISRLTLNLGASSSPLRKAAEQLGCWSAQAIVFSQAGGLKLTSLWTMRTVLLPAGYKAGKATKQSPANITHNARPALMTIRNDGRGVLMVQPKRGNTNLGPATPVCERSCVNVVIPAGTTTIQVQSPGNANANAGMESKFAYIVR